MICWAASSGVRADDTLWECLLTVGGTEDDAHMSALIGVRIELRDAHGELVGAVHCEDQFEAVAVPQRGDLVALAAITGLPAPDSSLGECDSLQGLADAFPFSTVHHLEHHPTTDHQVGERPGCTVVLHGRAPSDIDGATALVRLFGLKGWTISPVGAASEAAFNQAANAWLAREDRPPSK